MHVSSRNFKHRSILLACFAVASFFFTSVWAGVPIVSEKMPKASKSLLIDIESVGSKIIVVGERGHILLSDDQGQSWAQADVPEVQMLNAVYFPTESDGWAVGHDGNIVHTNDGGETWVLQRDGLKEQKTLNIAALSNAKRKVEELTEKVEAAPSAEADAVSPVTPTLDSDAEGEVSDEPVLTVEEQLEEAKSDLEKAQDRLEASTIAPPLMDVWFADANNGWAVGAFGTLLQTTNAGKTWIDRSPAIKNTDGYHLNAVMGVGGIIFIAGEAGYLVYSQDNGQSWVKGNIGYDGSIFGVLAPKSGSFIIATGLRGNAFRSTDGGVTWERLNTGVDYSLSGGFVSGEDHVVLAGAGGSVAVSNDKGSTFKHYSLPSHASLSGVVGLEGGQLLLVGQGGVHHFDVNSVKE